MRRDARKFVGYFVWKITILRQKIIFFPILGGARAGCAPPGSAPDNGSCHKQQMINNDKLNHGKPQLQLWIDSLNEIFLSRWTAHEQWNITFILLKTRREEGHQFVNLLPDRQNLWLYSGLHVSCHTKTSKSPHAFAMCSIRTDLLKQENEKIDSL